MAPPPIALQSFLEGKDYRNGDCWRFVLKGTVKVHLPSYLRIENWSEVVPVGRLVVLVDQDEKVRAILDSKGWLCIYAGYAWDGCSPKQRVKIPFTNKILWLGTPDYPCTRLPSLIHDLCYQFGHSEHWNLERDECDMLFYNLMVASGASKGLAGTYYAAVSRLGERFYRENDSSSYLDYDHG